MAAKSEIAKLTSRVQEIEEWKAAFSWEERHPSILMTNLQSPPEIITKFRVLFISFL